MRYKETALILYLMLSIPFFIFYLYNWEITVFSLLGSTLAALVFPLILMITYFIEL